MRVIDRADKVLSLISYCDDFIPLDAVVSAVSHLSGYPIEMERCSFSCLSLPSSVGAMLSIHTEPYRVARIVVNLDWVPVMQRFAVAHELGHLLLDVPGFRYADPDDGNFTLSTGISADVTSSSSGSLYDRAESLANEFAVRVLIPRSVHIRDLRSGGVSRLAHRCGVPEEAVYSRFLLSHER